MARILFLAAVVAAISAGLALSLLEAEGCGVARHPDSPSIHIAEESAIIVWDPVKKMQHFIRRAAFDTKAPDFGFLVPTPTPPQLPLAEVEDGIFRATETWILPKTVEQTQWKFEPLMCMFAPMTKMAAPMAFDKVGGKPDVRILHEQKVGGFEVKILEAEDADALTKWIKEHGYSADPELYAWLKPYVDDKWKISAFKISQDPKSGQLARTKAVRMSFKTERPFFPYREPEAKIDKPNEKHQDNKEDNWRVYGGRLLRVFFVSGMRVDGRLGPAVWHATIPWSDALTDEQRKQLARQTGVPEEDLPASAWMTTFEDRASPRPGKEDVYFEPAAERTPILPPPFIKYNVVHIPSDCVLVSVVFLSLLVVAVVRKKVWFGYNRS